MDNLLQWLGFSSLLFVVLSSASLSGLMSEKVGIINIAINGIMIIGALVFSILGQITNKSENTWYWQMFALIITCIITGFFALLHGIATITFKADHIVSGMAINILASGIGLFFTSIPNFASGDIIYNHFNVIEVDKYGIINLYLFIILIIASAIFIFLKFTRKGMNYKAIGENQYAAYAMGINVNKNKYIAIFISGILAGFAGSIYTLYNSSMFIGNVSGLGYTALAIMICAQWKSEFIVVIAILFALLTGASNVIWDNDVFKKSQDLFRTLPYAITIILMIMVSKTSMAPKSLGQTFLLDSK